MTQIHANVGYCDTLETIFTWHWSIRIIHDSDKTDRQPFTYTSYATFLQLQVKLLWVFSSLSNCMYLNRRSISVISCLGWGEDRPKPSNDKRSKVSSSQLLVTLVIRLYKQMCAHPELSQCVLANINFIFKQNLLKMWSNIHWQQAKKNKKWHVAPRYVHVCD